MKFLLALCSLVLAIPAFCQAQDLTPEAAAAKWVQLAPTQGAAKAQADALDAEVAVLEAAASDKRGEANTLKATVTEFITVEQFLQGLRQPDSPAAFVGVFDEAGNLSSVVVILPAQIKLATFSAPLMLKRASK